MDRRNFILGAAASSGLSWSATTPNRLSINNRPATNPLVMQYAKAVDAMRKLPGSDPRNWSNQAKIHDLHCPHGNWWFLPWHRAYLHYFEQICRDVLQDASFALPYWDWSADQSIPAPFLVKTSSLFDGIRGGTKVDVNVLNLNVIRNLVGTTNLVDLFSGATTIDAQRQTASQGALESGPHNHVHVAIGGDMGTFLSPLDPIFWLHHCNIDRIWASWNRVKNHNPPTGSLWADHKLTEFYDPIKKTKVTPTVADISNLTAERGYMTYVLPPGLVPSPGPGPGPGPNPVISKISVFSLSAHNKAAPSDLRMTTSEANLQAVTSAAASNFTLNANVGLDTAMRKMVPVASSVPVGEFYLFLDDVTIPANSTTAYRVFLNAKEPNANTPLSDPSYAGTIHFFGGDHAGHGGGTSFALNVTKVLKDVQIQKRPPQVSFVPVDIRTRQSVRSPVKVGKIRLTFIEGM